MDQSGRRDQKRRYNLFMECTLKIIYKWNNNLWECMKSNGFIFRWGFIPNPSFNFCLHIYLLLVLQKTQYLYIMLGRWVMSILTHKYKWIKQVAVVSLISPSLRNIHFTLLISHWHIGILIGNYHISSTPSS